MALPFQKGFLRLEGGSLGETTFMKKNGQHRAKEKIVTVSKQTWKHDPRFKDKRGIAAEFTNAVAAAKMIRGAVSPFTIAKDVTLSNRLRKLMIGIVSMDIVSAEGERRVQPANLQTLCGFNFNKAVTLRSVFNTPYSTSIKRKTGKILINIPAFTPSERIIAPKGTTHFKIIAAAIAIDLASHDHYGETFSSDDILWDEAMNSAINIELPIPPKSKLPILIYLGVQFKQDMGNMKYAIAQGKTDALCIVEVDVDN